MFTSVHETTDAIFLHVLVFSASVFYSLLFIVFDILPLLVLISFLHHWGQRERGGGPRPVGKVRLPATELCIKPFHWQLKLSPAYVHNTVLSLSPSLSPSFLHIPEVTAVFSSVSHVVGIMAVHACKQIYLASCHSVL